MKANATSLEFFLNCTNLTGLTAVKGGGGVHGRLSDLPIYMIEEKFGEVVPNIFLRMFHTEQKQTRVEVQVTSLHIVKFC